MNFTNLNKQFPDQESCLSFLEELRWKGSPECPYCQSHHNCRRRSDHRHHCHDCNKAFSVYVGTLFENTKLPLKVWFLAVSLVVNAKKGIASRQLGRQLGISKESALYLQTRLRAAMADGDPVLPKILSPTTDHLSQNRKVKPANTLIKNRGNGLKEKVSSIYGKWVRPHFIGKNPLLEIPPVPIPKLPVNEKNQEQKALFAREILAPRKTKGKWTLISRGIIGQYHIVSSEYLHGYIDEFVFRGQFPEPKTAFFEVIRRMLRTSPVNSLDMQNRAA